MLKALTGIAIISLFLLSPVLQVKEVFNYTLNKTEIAASFCVNKDNPELKCNGKCHLKKSLKHITIKTSPVSKEEPQLLQDYRVLYSEDISTVNLVAQYNYESLTLKRNNSFWQILSLEVHTPPPEV